VRTFTKGDIVDAPDIDRQAMLKIEPEDLTLAKGVVLSTFPVSLYDWRNPGTSQSLISISVLMPSNTVRNYYDAELSVFSKLCGM
jgi:hypothetical protein